MLISVQLVKNPEILASMESTRRAGRGARMCGDVQLQRRCRRLLVALLAVLSTIFAVNCVTAAALAPAPSQKIVPNFNQDDEVALRAILENWTERNPQLTDLLHWNSSSSRHPCDVDGKADNVLSHYEGAWRGVFCRSGRKNVNGSVNVSVSGLSLFGSNVSCEANNTLVSQCDFKGIDGVLPSAIANLTNLEALNIEYNPNLVGSIPIEIWKMPKLGYLYLNNNNLSGAFPASKDLNPSSKLIVIDISSNQLDGPVDFEGLKFAPSKIYYNNLNISNNKFNGIFSPGVNLDVERVDLSNNYFNEMIFEVYNKTNNTKHYMPSLREINIENNNFSGKFPHELLNLSFPALQTILAGGNQYNTLQLPDISFENFSSVSTIFLTNNKLGEVQYAPNQGPYTAHNLQFSNDLFLAGNPWCNQIETQVHSTLCRRNRSDNATLIDAHKSSSKSKIIIATSTSSFGFILLITGLYVWRLMRRIQALAFVLGEFEKKDVKPNLYSYKEIKVATKNFDKRNKLGEGGFGVVYKGELFDGTTVAVKKLNLSSSQMLSEFLNEVVVISGLKHRNLVKLKGCCLGDGDQRILVFEYVENKNLGEALSLSGDIIEHYEPPHLDWEARFNIIIGIARGLAYLHQDLQLPVIHRDIKANNILLDKEYNPKIADFGLAYFFPSLKNKDTHLTLEHVPGTRGYCSPEYALHGHISTALDVYSFGIVVLEIISGRKSIDPQKLGEEVSLQEWAWKQFEEQTLITLIDSKMKHLPSDFEAIMRVISVALACVQYKAAKRPKMQDVVTMLLGNMAIVDFSRDFEHGDGLRDVISSSSVTSIATSSYWGNDDPHVDKYSLLNNTHVIEMNSMTL